MDVVLNEVLPSVDDGPVFCVRPDTVSDVSVGVPAVTQMPSRYIFIIKSESDILNILIRTIKKHKHFFPHHEVATQIYSTKRKTLAHFLSCLVNILLKLLN